VARKVSRALAYLDRGRNMITTLPLPPFCLTLTPPWPQAIAYAGKRLENRHRSVAKGIGTYRGMIGLSQSKTPRIAASEWDACNSLCTDIELDHGLIEGTLGMPEDIKVTSGKLWLVADLVDVLPPDRCEGADWHVSGQWGLILGQVYEVEPVACMGGQGAWRPQWCFKCQKVVADSHGKVCKACKTTLAPASEAPALRVVREL